jgi:glyoxylase-like metal-dependent hydrolase (beta-lactamase superfamily II)
MALLEIQELSNGITCIDTGYQRPGLAACYLIEENGKAAFVDTGTSYSVPGLLELLSVKGIPREDVSFVMPTHVHLDHAGGAGELMRHLPNAKLIAHPRGARHLIDPSKLTAGAIAVYGEAGFRKGFGKLSPISEQRVIIADDGFELNLNGRPLMFLDTPGHARHHYSIFDKTSRGFFTGDVFGLAYQEFCCATGPFVFPTTTPVQFEPAAWHQSLSRLLRYKPERMFLTHYGMITQVEVLAEDLGRRIDMLVQIARAAPRDDRRHNAILQMMTDMLIDELARNGCSMTHAEAIERFQMDLELNTQGLEIWLDRGA